MEIKNVTATEFRQKSGLWLDEAGKAPIIITKHDRPSRVVMDYDMYKRLAAYATRKVFLASEMTEEHRKMIEKAEYEGPDDPELEALMD